MDIQMLTNFFMWCTIINGALLVFWAVIFCLAPNLVYNTQKMWIPIEREFFNQALYAFIGLFKTIYIVFNVVPFIALLIIGEKL